MSRFIWKSFFNNIVLVLCLVGAVQNANAQCAPAPDPDLNNDGIVSLADLYLVTSKYGLTSSSAGFSETADTNCDGKINNTDVVYVKSAMGKKFPVTSPVNVEVSTSPNDLNILQGQTQNIATSLNFTTKTTGIAYTVIVSQTVAPSGGLSLSPPIDGTTFTPSANFGTVLNQGVSALAAGVYEITTTATISQTGQTSTTKAKVTVTSGQEASLVVNEPGSDPGALALNTATTVVFSVQVQGADLDKVSTVTLANTTTGNSLILNDEGQEGDLSADDGTYSGTTLVDTNGMLAQQCQSFLATATTNNGPVASPIYKLCTTGFPIGTQPSDLTHTVMDPSSGALAVADEIMIGFVSGTTEDRVNAVVATINGTVVGTIPGLGIYQVRLSSPVSSFSQLQEIISALSGVPDVAFAEVNPISTGQTVQPTDPKFSDQYALKKIRADEAWYIARGAVTIAVVDSGVDLSHPDLDGKIIKGKDFVDGGDPDDQYGHGTHVAGIAAAETNNGDGIAGVSWSSKILVVRSFDQNNNFTGAAAVDGIKYAADKGARIINFSGRAMGGKSVHCAAASYATGKGSLLIAAAGNDTSSNEVYPAACSGVIAVGNTKSDDTRASDSNFGSWVDLAAPGVDILSTVPTGTCALCDATRYRKLSGTSMSTPMVSGAAAVLLSRESLTNAQVEERLKRTAQKLPGLQLGEGRIDLFEAVFNGSFEEENMALWQRQGTVSSIDKLESLKPQDRKRMGYVSTGPAADQVSGNLTQTFQVQAGVTTIPVTFKYAFLSEEFPEFVGTQFNDAMKITIQAPNGTTTTLASEEINTSAYSMIGGIDFQGGDNTVGWTGWKTVSMEIPVTAGAGTYKLFLTDAGDDVYDTVVLIDCIQFRKQANMICTPAP